MSLFGDSGSRKAARLFLVITAMFCASPAAAQDWQRLDDGRVVIEVFGEKLAFFPEDGPLVRFMAPRHRELFDLEAAIANPPMARQKLSELGQKEDWVRVVVDNDIYWKQQQRGRKFLGRFDWSDGPTLGPGWRLSFSITRMPTAARGHRQNLPLPNEYFPKAIGPSPTGFTAYPSRVIGNKRRREPTKTRYTLPGDQRVRPTSMVLEVLCTWSGAPDRICSSQLLSGDRHVRAHWYWFEDQFPENEWRELDEQFRVITDFVFIERGREDFE